MKYELMWNDLKGHLKALSENIERSVEHAEVPSYSEDVDAIYRALQEEIVREREKSTLRIVRNILVVMESMEEAYR